MAYLLFSTRLVTSPEVIEHRLPRDFDYHRMPAPWVQIKILTIFRILGASDQQTSAQMYEILTEVPALLPAGPTPFSQDRATKF